MAPKRQQKRPSTPSLSQSSTASSTSSQSSGSQKLKIAKKTLNQTGKKGLIIFGQTPINPHVHNYSEPELGVKHNQHTFKLTANPAQHNEYNQLLSPSGRFFNLIDDQYFPSNTIFKFKCSNVRCASILTILKLGQNGWEIYETAHTLCIFNMTQRDTTQLYFEIDPTCIKLNSSDFLTPNIPTEHHFIQSLLSDDHSTEILLEVPGCFKYITSYKYESLITKRKEYKEYQNLKFGVGFLCEKSIISSDNIKSNTCSKIIILKTTPTLELLKQMSPGSRPQTIKINFYGNLYPGLPSIPIHSHSNPAQSTSTTSITTINDFTPANFVPFNPIVHSFISQYPTHKNWKFITVYGNNRMKFFNAILLHNGQILQRTGRCTFECDRYKKICRGIGKAYFESGNCVFRQTTAHSDPVKCLNTSKTLKVFIPLDNDTNIKIIKPTIFSNTSCNSNLDPSRETMLLINNHLYSRNVAKMNGKGILYECTNKKCHRKILQVLSNDLDKSASYSIYCEYNSALNEFLELQPSHNCLKFDVSTHSVQHEFQTTDCQAKLKSGSVIKFWNTRNPNNVPIPKPYIPVPNTIPIPLVVRDFQSDTILLQNPTTPLNLKSNTKIVNLFNYIQKNYKSLPLPAPKIHKQDKEPLNLKKVLTIVLDHIKKKYPEKKLKNDDESLKVALVLFKNECELLFQSKITESKLMRPMSIIPYYENLIGWSRPRKTLRFRRQEKMSFKCQQEDCYNVSFRNHSNCWIHTKEFEWVLRFWNFNIPTQFIQKFHNTKHSFILSQPHYANTLFLDNNLNTNDKLAPQFTLRAQYFKFLKQNGFKDIFSTKICQHEQFVYPNSGDGPTLAKMESTAVNLFHILKYALDPSSARPLIARLSLKTTLFSAYVRQYCEERGLVWYILDKPEFLEKYEGLFQDKKSADEISNIFDIFLDALSKDRHKLQDPELKAIFQPFCWGDLAKCDSKDRLVEPNLYKIRGIVDEKVYHGLNEFQKGKTTSKCHEIKSCSSVTSYEQHKMEHKVSDNLCLNQSTLHAPDRVKNAEFIGMLATILIEMQEPAPDSIINMDIPVPDITQHELDVLASYFAINYKRIFIIQYNPTPEQLAMPILVQFESRRFLEPGSGSDETLEDPDATLVNDEPTIDEQDDDENNGVNDDSNSEEEDNLDEEELSEEEHSLEEDTDVDENSSPIVVRTVERKEPRQQKDVQSRGTEVIKISSSEEDEPEFTPPNPSQSSQGSVTGVKHSPSLLALGEYGEDEPEGGQEEIPPREVLLSQANVALEFLSEMLGPIEEDPFDPQPVPSSSSTAPTPRRKTSNIFAKKTPVKPRVSSSSEDSDDFFLKIKDRKSKKKDDDDEDYVPPTKKFKK